MSEFLLTNALGGYASADLSLGNTRKYHGLLVTSDSHLRRQVIVNRVLEEVYLIDQTGNTTRDDSDLQDLSKPAPELFEEDHYIPLTTNIYQDNVMAPDAREYLKDAKIKDGNPIWEYELGKAGRIVKTLGMWNGANSSTIQYSLFLNQPVKLKLVPLLTMRSFHALRNDLQPEMIDIEPLLPGSNKEMPSSLLEGMQVKFNGNNTHLELELHKRSKTGAHTTLRANPDIYYNFHYPREQERGYDHIEDLLSPGTISVFVPAGSHQIQLQMHYNQDNSTKKNLYTQNPFTADDKLLDDAKWHFYQLTNHQSKFSDLLLRQAQQFTIAAADQPAVVAGYHWFGDWGRDTFISFKGLYLLTGKLDEAKKLLVRWSKLFKDGLLPNRPFENEYNSIDSVFWFFVAVYEYWKASGDLDIVPMLFIKVHHVISAFQNGEHGLTITEHGMINNANKGKSLTWMDANYNGEAATDRAGEAVEIQLLWYNMLKIVGQVADTLNNFKRSQLSQQLEEATGDRLNELLIACYRYSQTIEDFFLDEFWVRADRKTHKYENVGSDLVPGYLADLYDPIGKNQDDSIRPNQVIGLALPFQFISKERQRTILKTVELHLLTAVGLRTLSPQHPDYKASYSGDQKQRDYAYHQGTIWPFLLGFYIKAYLNAYQQSKSAKAYCRKLIDKLYRHLNVEQIEYVPEIYDPETLKPAGCISQAWSAATLLEALYEIYHQ